MQNTMHDCANFHIFYIFSNNHFSCDKYLTCDKRALCDRGFPVSLAFGERSEPIASIVIIRYNYNHFKFYFFVVSVLYIAIVLIIGLYFISLFQVSKLVSVYCIR